MKLALLATCSGGACPTIYAEDGSADVVVQGYPVTAPAAGVSVPADEFQVRVPRAVLLEAAARLTDM